MTPSRAPAFLPSCLAALLVACGGNDAEPPIVEDAPSCPAGHASHPSVGCLPVGPQGCAAMFLDADGFCDPSPDVCEPGTIAKLDEGCVPIGISGCAAVFVEPDGHCYPLPEKCRAGTFPVPTLGCVAIDGDRGCGTGTWGNIEASPDTVWVDPSFSGTSPDGSQRAPFTTIAEALAAAVSGGRIALAAGNYAEPVTLDMPLELVGRCPSMVTISGTQDVGFLADPAIVLAVAPNAIVRGVRISGAGIGVVSGGGASLELSGTHIDQTTSFGIIAQFGTLTVARSLISRTKPQPLSGDLGHGIQVESAQVRLEQSALVENQLAALAVLEASTTMVDDSVIAHTQKARDEGGYGAYVDTGASLSVTKSAVLANHDVGIVALRSGTRARVSGCVVARTEPETAGLRGYGVHGEGGAQITVEASALVENHHVALASLDAPTSVAADRCLLARSQPHPNDLDAGYGAYVGGGATLSIASSNLLDNHTVALAVSDAGTSATVTGSVIARTQPRPRDQRGGIGALVTLGANLSLESTALRENHGMGVASGLDGAIVRARTSVIAGTLPEPDGAEGIGVLATLGALELESCLVRDSRVAAVLVGQAPANATITRSFLYGVSEGTFHTYDGIERIVDTFGGVGDGIVTTFQANVTVTDTLVRDASRVALLFHESGGSIRGVDAAAEHYGLVLQGGSLPDWDHPSNRFSGGDQAVVQQGSLPVPAPPPLPSD